MTHPFTDIPISVLVQKIDNLQDTLNEVRSSVAALDKAQRQSELDAVKDHTRIENKADAANTRIDRLVAQMTILERDIPALMLAYRIITFIGGALGLSIIALIWSLITGAAKITLTP